MERLEFDLLFRWFVGLGLDDPVWDASVFSKNRERLFSTEIAQGFPSPHHRPGRAPLSQVRESLLCYMGHALIENRNGLAVAGELTHATGTASRS